MRIWPFTLAFLPLTLLAHAADTPAPGPNRATEAKAGSFSAARGHEFLDAVSLKWTQGRKCGTCHTNVAHLMARAVEHGKKGGAGSPAEREVREFFEGRVRHWDRWQRGDAPRWDTEVVVTAVALAFHDARTAGKLSGPARTALDRMWTVQKPTGEWDWLKCEWPPQEHDDYFGVVFAAVGAGVAPDGYAKSESARAGVARLKDYLKKTPAPTLHHKLWLLWAATKLEGLLDEAGRQKVVTEVLALQRADGGWSLPSLGDWKGYDGRANDVDAASDGYGTGLVVWVLRQAGRPADDPAVAKGVAWLKANQRASGRWWTRSLNTDAAHYIAHAGTAYALMALAACE